MDGSTADRWRIALVECVLQPHTHALLGLPVSTIRSQLARRRPAASWMLRWHRASPICRALGTLTTGASGMQPPVRVQDLGVFACVVLCSHLVVLEGLRMMHCSMFCFDPAHLSVLLSLKEVLTPGAVHVPGSSEPAVSRAACGCDSCGSRRAATCCGARRQVRPSIACAAEHGALCSCGSSAPYGIMRRAAAHAGACATLRRHPHVLR